MLSMLPELLTEFTRKRFPVPRVEKRGGFVEDDESVTAFENFRDIFEVDNASTSTLAASCKEFPDARIAIIRLEIKDSVRIDVTAFAPFLVRGLDHLVGLAAAGLASKCPDHFFVAIASKESTATANNRR